jgi:diaminopimelate decarboxylase
MRAPETRETSRPFWVRPGMGIDCGRLTLAGRDTERLAREHGTPLYAYDLKRIEEQVRALQGSLARAGLRYRTRLAMKAQREPEVLSYVRRLGSPGSPQSVGLDVCSPGEALHALASGWRPEEVSYTGTNVSERDLDVILAHPFHLNVDLLSQLVRVGRRAAGRMLGIRVNPRAGATWGGWESSLYSGTKPTKFGIYEEQFDEALAIARRYRLTIDTVHFHVGDGFLDDGLSAFDEAVRRGATMARRLMDAGCPITEVNTGGGLGVPQLPAERPLDLDAYADVLAAHLGPLDVVVGVEPGDFLCKESAILLAEVVTAEDRLGVPFIGLDVGWNVMNDRFIYDAPFEVALCRAANAPRTRNVVIAGHINEGDDLFAEDYPFPEVEEGDIVAIINVGGYNQAMTMTHCMRPAAQAVYFEDRAVPDAKGDE